MDLESASQLLASPEPQDRLRAARFLAKHATEREGSLIRAALKRESVSYIKRALASALSLRGTPFPSPASSPEPEIPPSVRAQLYGKAVSEVAGTLIHEIAPVVGVLHTVVAENLPNYEESPAKIQLEKLEDLLDAIANLKIAADPPRVEQFDLVGLRLPPRVTQTVKTQLTVR